MRDREREAEGRGKKKNLEDSCSEVQPNILKISITLMFQNDDAPNAMVILLSSTNIFGDNMQYSNLYAHSILVCLE